MEADRLEKLRLEAEEKRIREEEAAERERQFKTTKYFEFDKYNRKQVPHGEPMYYGDKIIVNGAWRKHGYGQEHYNNKIIFDGQYVNSVAHGNGKYIHEDGSIW